jgi:hypothetical protein
MRKKLASEVGLRKKFKAIFSRIGKKVNYKGYTEETILLTDIKDRETEKVMADHLWFSYSLAFQKAKLAIGDAIEFEARVKEYQKGYVNKGLKINHRISDFKLSHPTQIKKIIDF